MLYSFVATNIGMLLFQKATLANAFIPQCLDVPSAKDLQVPSVNQIRKKWILYQLRWQPLCLLL